jgi:hypothetical protein
MLQSALDMMSRRNSANGEEESGRITLPQKRKIEEFYMTLGREEV